MSAPVARIGPVKHSSLFNHGCFFLHSGGCSDFIVECEHLSDRDLAALAAMAAPRLPHFGAVEGVPEGGLRFAAALKKHVTPGAALLLIADDVLTVGTSMEAHRSGRPAAGIVIFARGNPPQWVSAIWRAGL